MAMRTRTINCERIRALLVKKWEVFKDDSSLGFMTAKQIRHALREGVIDPFDMVSAEGSTIKSELVEVDEIFEEDTNAKSKSAAVEQAPQTEIPAKIINLDQAKEPEPRPSRQFPEMPSLPEGSKGGGSYRRDGSYKGEGSKKTEGSHDKGRAKKFFLIDNKKRVLGPISAVEIQSLFQRGIISSNVKVQKANGDRLVTVRQFIANYSEKRIKALADQAAAAKAGNPSSKVLNELYQNMKSKRMAQKTLPVSLAWFAVLGAVITISSYLFISGKFNLAPEDRRRSTKKVTPVLSQQQLKKESSTAAKPEKAARPEADKPAVRPKKRSSRKAKAPRPKPKAPTPAVTQKAPPPTKSRPPRNLTTATRNVVPPAPTLTPTTPEPKLVAPTPPAAQPKVERKQGTIAANLSKIGGVVTISSLNYAPQDLENCSLKCRLKLTDPAGAVLEAVFFKGAYYEALKSAGKNVTITGTSKLEGGSLVIILQDVR